MKKYFFFLIFAFILMTGYFSACSKGGTSSGSAESSSEAEKTSLSAGKDQSALNAQSMSADTQSAAGDSRIVWIVEPELEYDDVYFCTMCGYTADTFTYIIDKATGRIAGDHYGHGGPYFLEWLYDSENGLFGSYVGGWGDDIKIYPISQFSSHFPSFTNTLNYVKQFDSANMTSNEEDWGLVYNLGPKYENSKYAISFGNKFLTEFVYDDPGNLSFGLIYKNAVPVTKDGKWGFIDTKGKIIVPLIFDHAESSDGETAFVKINGKYGIIDVRASSGR